MFERVSHHGLHHNGAKDCRPCAQARNRSGTTTSIRTLTQRCSRVEGTAMDDSACDRGNGAYVMLGDVHLNGGNIH